jgi:hypothetical protein
MVPPDDRLRAIRECIAGRSRITLTIQVAKVGAAYIKGIADTQQPERVFIGNEQDAALVGHF